MYLVLDTETTGLIRKQGGYFSPFCEYTDISAYDEARILSIGWELLDKEYNVINSQYYVIYPENFQIPKVSIMIHGITHEICEKEGVSFDAMIQQFDLVLDQCRLLIAHNVEFDANVIKSELFRRNFKEILEKMNNKPTYCTMKHGQRSLHQQRYPKLCFLYKHLYNEELANAHNALQDAIHCRKCFVKLHSDWATAQEVQRTDRA